MCGFCRRDFAVRGVVALRERIKGAESGDAGSEEEEGSTGEGRGGFVCV